MTALEIMLRNVIVFVLLAVPGVVLVKTKILKTEQSGVLSKVLMYIGMPFLILNSTLNVSFDGELLTTVLISAAFGVGYTMVCFFLSKPFTAMEKEEKTRGMMRFCSIFTNNGFLGIPLASAVFASQPLVLTCVIIINIITNALMYTLGIFLISGDKSTISLKKAFLNPVLIAFAVGLVCNLLGVKGYVPEISTYAGYLGNVVTPLSMLILGIKLGGVSLKPMFGNWKTYYVSAIKLVAVPAVVIALAFLLHSFWTAVSEEIILGLFVSFALPTAALATTFADGYDGDTENAVSFTLGTTLLSVATIPLLYWLLITIL